MDVTGWVKLTNYRTGLKHAIYTRTRSNPSPGLVRYALDKELPTVALALQQESTQCQLNIVQLDCLFEDSTREGIFVAGVRPGTRTGAVDKAFTGDPGLPLISSG